MSDERWTSPLGTALRLARDAALWGEPHRIGLWRRLWLALAEAERELGLADPRAGAGPDAGPPRRRRSAPRPRATSAASGTTSWRTCTRSATRRPTARPFLHLGATSAFVTDNADLLVMRDGLRLLLGRLIAVLSAPWRRFAGRTAALPCLAYTHFQPAQLTTVGKRATLWMQDFGLDVEELAHRLETRCASAAARARPEPRRPSSSSSQGDHDKVRELERRVTAKLGFRDQFAVTGQTYPRKADSMVLDALSGIAQSAAKMAVRPPPAAARGRAARAVRVGADRVQRHGLQAEPDAGGADRRPGPVRDLAPGQRGPHRGRASGWSALSTTAPTAG